MAADWIKVEKSTPRKPEVLRIAELLDIHPDHAFGLCVRFWFWCDDQMKTCHAQSVTIVTLDYTVGHTGFAKALLEVGWLLVRNGSLEIPNFDRHLSESAKKRADSLRRKHKQRDGNVGKSVTKKRDKNVTHKSESESESEKGNTKTKNKQKELAEEFSSWYSVYPRKAARGAAYAAYCKAVKRISLEHSIDTEAAVSQLQNWTIERVPQIELHEMQFRKQPATWLNQECYGDEFEKPVSRVATLEQLDAWSPK